LPMADSSSFMSLLGKGQQPRHMGGGWLP
jgi:hypothetical protein